MRDVSGTGDAPRPRRARPPRPVAGGGAPDRATQALEAQAALAVALLERFGGELVLALEAVGRGDDAAFDAAVAERERLVDCLMPVLVPLAAARREAAGVEAHDASCAGALARVDAALAHARHLHGLVADELRERAAARPAVGVAPVALVR
jgi:hypothetical protein